MKKLIVAISLIALMATPSFSARRTVTKKLYDITGTTIDNYTLSAGNVRYSEIIQADNVNKSAIIIAEDKSGGGGDVSVTTEYSIDASTWDTVYILPSATSGSIIADWPLINNLSNARRYIEYTPRVGPLMRYKYTANADSQINVWHSYQIED